LKCIEDHGDTKLECPTVTEKIVDGAALVQMLPPGSEKTFGQYAQTFAEFIANDSKSENLNRVNVVFDRYFPESQILVRKEATVRASPLKKPHPFAKTGDNFYV
jgi:hypothetical protein